MTGNQVQILNDPRLYTRTLDNGAHLIIIIKLCLWGLQTQRAAIILALKVKGQGHMLLKPDHFYGG